MKTRSLEDLSKWFPAFMHRRFRNKEGERRARLFRVWTQSNVSSNEFFPTCVLTHCTLCTDDSNHLYSNHPMPQLPWLQWAHSKHQSTHIPTLIIGCQLSYLSLETYYGSSVNIISLVPLYNGKLRSCWRCMNIAAKLSE